MGSIVRKITKPVAKFLDKVVPNEIKPALPYISAAVPFLAPTTGILGTMAGRAALSGGSNILAQLAQEGSEGDFSGLSALLATATGALSAPGTATYGPAGPPGSEQIIQSGSPGAADFFAQKAAGMDTGILKSGTEFLGKTSEGLASMGDILRPGGEAAGLNLATTKAALVPFTQGSTDLAMATARKALKDYEDELDAFNLQAGQAQEASDSARRAAIISSMTAAAFDQGIIDDTLAQLGLRDGGRVGLETGGTPEDNKKTFADYEKEEKIEEFTNLVDKLMTDEGVQDKGYAIRLASDLINMKNKDIDSDRLKFLNERSTLFALPTDKRPEPEYYDALDALEKRVDFQLGGRVGLEFGGIPAAVKAVEEKPKEFLVDKLKVTIQPGQSEMMGIMNAMMNDVDGVMPEDRKMEFYKLYLPQLYQQGEISKKEYEGLKDELFGEGKAEGGRIGFKDGSSTGSFGTDRYVSEMLESGSDLFNRGENFLNRYEDMVKEKKIDSKVFDMLNEYKNLQKEAETTEDKFQNTNLMDKAEETLDKDALKYYDKKAKNLEKKEDDLTKKEEGIIALEKKTNFDVSEITKTPDFQNWLKLYETDTRKALNHPYVDIYLGVLGSKLKGRDKSYDETVGFANGGLMGLKMGGMPMEMDYRQGGFIPVGSKERADDVPARLSKNEFVMTADAVRAAGGGSVNKGAQRMYELMNNLEARV